MKLEQINHLNFPINARQDMRNVAQSGNLAAQVEKVKSNILDNTARQISSESSRDNSSFPMRIHNTSESRVMRLLNKI